MRSRTFAIIAGTTITAVLLLTLPAVAQNDNKKDGNKPVENNAGPLQPPKPYGDRGHWDYPEGVHSG